jgi:hypothetical protein
MKKGAPAALAADAPFSLAVRRYQCRLIAALPEWASALPSPV